MPRKREINTSVLYSNENLKSEINRLLDYPLVVVEAPMGYGKTTAIKEYMREKSINFKWLTIYSESLDVFWASFLRILKKLGWQKQEVKLPFPLDELKPLLVDEILFGKLVDGGSCKVTVVDKTFKLTFKERTK